MKYRKIMKTGTRVSPLGFGAMRLPVKSGRIDRKEAERVINHAIDNGVNLIDTAFFYHNGESEIFLKDILAQRRDEILLSTKLPSMFVKDGGDFQKFLDKQLERLEVDYIDFYYLHALNLEQFNFFRKLGVLEFLDKIKDEGVVGHVGFSFHDNYEALVEIIDAYSWDMCLLQYNFVDTDAQATTRGVKYAYQQGVSVFIMEPLKGGLLADNVPCEIKQLLCDENIEDTPAVWALRWLFDKEYITCILSGMNTAGQVDENIQTARTTRTGSITDDERRVYDGAKRIYKSLMPVDCTACGYCMDCPYGVDIPACFKIYNNRKIFNRSSGEYLTQLSGLTGGDGSYAGKCHNCGVCVEKCPQKINIPEQLKLVRKEMEMPGFRYIVPVLRRIGNPLYGFYLSHR